MQIYFSPTKQPEKDPPIEKLDSDIWLHLNFMLIAVIDLEMFDIRSKFIFNPQLGGKGVKAAYIHATVDYLSMLPLV